MLFAVESYLFNAVGLIVGGLNSILNQRVVSSCELVITNFMHQVLFALVENDRPSSSLPPYCSLLPIKVNFPFHLPPSFILTPLFNVFLEEDFSQFPYTLTL